MKKLLSATAALAALSFGAAQAADQQVIATVEAVCEATLQQDLLADFGIDPSTGAGFEILDIILLECNDPDGATVELRSAEGILESDDNGDFGVPYSVWLFGPGIALGDLVLNNNTGTNDLTETTTVDFGDVAGGSLYGLGFNLAATPVWAGGYSDTISVEIQAN